jgi:hypothetical protein
VGHRPDEVWPWLVQLGKGRAGWYLPRSVERFLPRGRRAIRHLDPRWQRLGRGDAIPDYGLRRDDTFTAAIVEAPRALVYRSQRGRMSVSWAIVLTPIDADGSRIHLRLRMGPVKRRWLLLSLGEWIDAATIAGMRSGLIERLAENRRQLSH